MTRPRVMIVEDDEVIREVYSLKFELEGFPIETADNGQVALAKAESFAPDIILLDMMMPIMGGLDFLRAFARPEGTEVIVFSNISAPQQMSDMTRLGASDYWVKSDYTPERAVDAVSERWAKRHS